MGKTKVKKRNAPKFPDKFKYQTKNKKTYRHRLEIIEKANKSFEAELKRVRYHQRCQTRKDETEAAKTNSSVMFGVRRVSFSEKKLEIYEYERWIEQK